MILLSSISNILENNLLERAGNPLIIYLNNHIDKNKKTDNIFVKYNEDYEYGIFDEYNLDADTIKSINEYKNIEECLSTQNECSYIENYSYSIYLEISLKESSL